MALRIKERALAFNNKKVFANSAPFLTNAKFAARSEAASLHALAKANICSFSASVAENHFGLLLSSTKSPILYLSLF